MLLLCYMVGTARARESRAKGNSLSAVRKEIVKGKTKEGIQILKVLVILIYKCNPVEFLLTK